MFLGPWRIVPARLRRANATTVGDPLVPFYWLIGSKQAKQGSRFSMTFPPKDRRRPGKAGDSANDNNGRNKPAAPPSPSNPPSVAEEAQRTFGATVQRLREQSGLSQDQLGRDSGMTPAEMKEIEEGRGDTTLFTIIRLANRLGTTVEELLRGIP